jgi:membrane protease YdiL (CAAX protease family)
VRRPTDRTGGRWEVERLPELALVPALTTFLYYTLSPALQMHPAIQFLPQATGYAALAIWAGCNTEIARRLGLRFLWFKEALLWGVPIGLALGILNVSVILWLVPSLGGDITFLQETPHARMPPAVMLPWGILVIAIAVELNFRGFLLGRLATLLQRTWLRTHRGVGSALAVMISSIVFSFDPFMVTTFKHLHWIAVWDGMVWGVLLLRTHSLYVPIVAHAIEVIVMYSALKAAFA